MYEFRIRIPKWSTHVVLLVLALLITAAFTRPNAPRNAAEQVWVVPVGMNVSYADGRPITQPVRIFVFRVGEFRMPNWQFVVIEGKPDAKGYLSTQTKVPINPRWEPVFRSLLSK